MKRVWVLLGLLVVITSVLLLRQPALAPGGTPVNGRQATLNGRQFFLETADTEEAREKGLSGRNSLPAARGMLFVFDQASRPCFWMKDTLLPLDMLWFDSEYKLVYQQQNVQPTTYPETFCPDQDAQYVVELAAGTAANLNLKPGNVLTLK
jgi:uncharacterized membrane protein (UPF0127 family)